VFKAGVPMRRAVLVYWVQTWFDFSLCTGQKWKDMRSTLSPAFTSSKMKMLFTLMSETSRQLTAHLENRLRKQAAAEDKPVSYYAVQSLQSLSAFHMSN
jgi:cytochrome P450 family 9